MKYNAVVVLGVILVAAVLFTLHGQSNVPIILAPNQPSVSGCIWPGTVANGLAICPLSLPSGPAMAIAVNGGPFVQIPMSTTGGVTSFNKRAGDVLPATADYSFSQLSGQITGAQMPPTVTCTFTQTVGASNTITLSACK